MRIPEQKVVIYIAVFICLNPGLQCFLPEAGPQRRDLLR